MLSDALNHNKRDADLLIATTAIDCAVDHHTQVICEDADIFQLLVNKVKPNSKPLYMVTDKPNANYPCIYINAIRDELGDEYANCLPVLHAISGCDTTSRLHGIGKLSVLNKSAELFVESKPFLSPDSTGVEIEIAGRRMLCLLYGNNEKTGQTEKTYSLNKIRKKKCKRM